MIFLVTQNTHPHLAFLPTATNIDSMNEPFTASVVLYTTRWCGYCHAAKRLLKSLEVDFEEVSVEGRGDLRNWLMEASGQRTVPQIFINRESIGGYSELASLHQASELLPRLRQAQAVAESDGLLPR